MGGVARVAALCLAKVRQCGWYQIVKRLCNGSDKLFQMARAQVLGGFGGQPLRFPMNNHISPLIVALKINNGAS